MRNQHIVNPTIDSFLLVTNSMNCSMSSHELPHYLCINQNDEGQETNESKINIHYCFFLPNKPLPKPQWRSEKDYLQHSNSFDDAKWIKPSLSLTHLLQGSAGPGATANGTSLQSDEKGNGEICILLICSTSRGCFLFSPRYWTDDSANKLILHIKRVTSTEM